MRIGKQTGRVITNTENRFGNDELRSDLHDLLSVVRAAVEEGALDERRAAALADAACEVERAAGDGGPHSSRFRRAIENLTHVSSGMTATAGIAEAVESMLHTVAGP